MNAFRLPHGGEIDRGRPLAFTFNGERMTGYAGDTLASALLANGRVFVARSFKYHRPRGIVAHGSEEPNALVTLRGEGGRIDPNTRATVVELFEGLDARSQNHWPSLAFDIGAVSDVLAPLFTAGFYYKTFMWPASFWNKVYEPAIRAAAGLGRAPEAPDPDRYQHRHAYCDVLIVGGGPAGLAGAPAAARRGAGGVAAGAHERPLVFADNDRPGILLAESARAYVTRYGVTPGHRVVVATCGDAAYTAARELLAAGVAVAALVDVRPVSQRQDTATLRA